MSNLEPMLERNRAFAETGAHDGLAIPPKHDLMVISCIDARVDPAHVLGVGLGDALVVRNAGGRVNDQVVAEIAFITMLAETMLGDAARPFEVAIIHHTACGTAMLVDDDFRNAYVERIGADQSDVAIGAVVDPAATVADDVARVLSAPSIPTRVSASGHVYDVATGLVTTIVEATAARS